MKIILAIDGSACSEQAVQEVARRPWPADSQLKMICVVEPPAPLTSEPWVASAAYFNEVETASRKQAEDTLSNAVAKLREGTDTEGLDISTDVLTGSPKDKIIEEADKWGADLVVVGSHGYRSWERMLLGSVSQAVAMRAECSVEIVRNR